MNIEELLDQLEELVDNSWNLPLAGGKCVVNAEKVRDMLDDIRLNLPTEIRQAKAIVSDRADIINGARKEADTIVKRAEKHARDLVEQNEIVKTATARANEIMANATKQAREMRQNAKNYSDALMKHVEDIFTKGLSDVRAGRQSLKSAGTSHTEE